MGCSNFNSFGDQEDELRFVWETAQFANDSADAGLRRTKLAFLLAEGTGRRRRRTNWAFLFARGMKEPPWRTNEAILFAGLAALRVFRNFGHQ